MRKMLLALHCLLPGGAINAAVALAEKLRGLGYQLEIASYGDGPMRNEFESMGMTVTVRKDMHLQAFAAEAEAGYDDILVNTLVMYKMVSGLNGRDVRVHWWIHEPPMYFIYFQSLGDEFSPNFWQELSDNVTVYAAGEFVHGWLRDSYGQYSHVLNFGVEDLSGAVEASACEEVSPAKVTFLIPSIFIQFVKGQDVMAEAIRRLPGEYAMRSEYFFLGDDWQDKVFYNLVAERIKGFGNARLLPAIGRSRLLALMKQADCIVAPSREDATNACIVEAMMLSKTCLCSDRTGISRYMQDCVDGFVFASGNADELCARLMLVIDNIDRLGPVAQNGRKVYERHFSMKVFEDNVRKYWKKIESLEKGV